jgi:hypothetical protein
MENKFCLIGNSHTSQFNNPNLNVLYGYGASICGLYNENSTLKLKERILDYQYLNPEKTLVFFLGQSDVEFIYYYKSIKNNDKIDINEFLDDIVNKYINFIIEYIKNPVVLGINPTVIKSTQHTFNVNFRYTYSVINPAGSYHLGLTYDDVKHFYDDYETRYNNNMQFNTKLSEQCKKQNIPYIELNKEILDDDMKVKSIYLPKEEDHHLVANYSLYVELINQLTPYI